MAELSRSRADNERLRIFMRLQRDVRGPSDPRNDPSGRFLASTERRSIPCYPLPIVAWKMGTPRFPSRATRAWAITAQRSREEASVLDLRWLDELTVEPSFSSSATQQVREGWKRKRIALSWPTIRASFRQVDYWGYAWEFDRLQHGIVR